MCLPAGNDVTQTQHHQQYNSCPSTPSSQNCCIEEDEEETAASFSPTLLSRQHFKAPKTLWQRGCLATFACLQNALVGGIVFGWASIDRTLLIASRDDGGPGLTPMQTTTIFSWASCIAMFSSLGMGWVLDRYGPRTASVACNLCVGLGCGIVSRASGFIGVAVGTCMMAFGGPGISSSIVHIANLFPQNQFLVMSVLCGSVTLSFSILDIFGDLWQRYGIGFHSLFGGYTFIMLGSIVGAFCLWPDTPFDQEDSDSYEGCKYQSNDNDDEGQKLLQTRPAQISAEQEYVEAILAHHQLCEEPLNAGLRQNLAFGRTRSYLESLEALAVEDRELPPFNQSNISLKDQPFWYQVRSQIYLRNLLIFIVTSFFVNFSIASISTELADQQVFSVESQHDLSRSFTLIMSGGLVGSILVGWSMDRVGVEACTVATLVLGQTSLLLQILGRTYATMLAGFVVYTLFRQFLFPIFIACLTAKLGYKYFGILSGIGFALSGTAQVFMASLVHHLAGDCHLQNVLVEGRDPPTCDHGKWVQFHLFQVAILCVLVCIPLKDQWERDKRQMAGHAQTPFGIEGEKMSSLKAKTASTNAVEQRQRKYASSYGSVVT